MGTPFSMPVGWNRPAPPPQPLFDLAGQTEDWRKEMGRLHEQMKPDVVRQLAKQELALAEARQKLARMMEAEKERQMPTALPEAQKPGFLDRLMHVMGGKGGALGGLAGRLGEATGLGSGAVKALGTAAVVYTAGIAAMKLFAATAQEAVANLGRLSAVLMDPSTDPSRFIAATGQGLKEFGDKIFYVNPVLGTLAKVGGQAAESLAVLMQAADGMAERYAAFSPDIMQAQAMANVTHTLGELRRAQQVGPDLARYLRARTELQQRIEDMKVRFMQRALPVLTRIVELIDGALAVSDNLPEKLANAWVDTLRGESWVIALARWLNANLNKPDESAWELPTDQIFNQQGHPIFPFSG